MAKTLQIVSSAYRCNLEEQDDPIVWIAHAMKGAGAELDVVLRGNAVNYAVKNQKVAALTFGGQVQKHPPNMERDITSLIGKGVEVYVVSEDAKERGLAGELLDGIKSVDRGGMAALFDKYEQVWNW